MNKRAQAAVDVQARLGHVFADQALLERALTHASAVSGSRKPADNERLEFLGDRVLGLVIAQALGERDPEAGAGDLSKRLHGLVSGEACATVARDIGLGEALRLPPGEAKRGARDQRAILADACEAVIAALYLELGLEKAAAIVRGLWASLLDAPHDPAAANPKSELQEWAAQRKLPQPAYEVVSRTGPAHAPTFEVELRVGELDPSRGRGGSRQQAEKAAAETFLTREVRQ